MCVRASYGMAVPASVVPSSKYSPLLLTPVAVLVADDVGEGEVRVVRDFVQARRHPARGARRVLHVHGVGFVRRCDGCRAHCPSCAIGASTYACRPVSIPGMGASTITDPWFCAVPLYHVEHGQRDCGADRCATCAGHLHRGYRRRDGAPPRRSRQGSPSALWLRGSALRTPCRWP